MIPSVILVLSSLLCLLVTSPTTAQSSEGFRSCELLGTNRTLCEQNSGCQYFIWPIKKYPKNTPFKNKKQIGCVTVPVVNCGIFWSKENCQKDPVNATCGWSKDTCMLKSLITTAPSKSPVQLVGCQRYDTKQTCSADPACAMYNGIKSCNGNNKECRTMNYGCRSATDFCEFTGMYQQKQCNRYLENCMWDVEQNICTKRAPTGAPTTFPPTPPPTCATAADLTQCDSLGPECRWFGMVKACNNQNQECWTSSYGCQHIHFCAFTRGKYFANQCKEFKNCFFEKTSQQCMYRPSTPAPTIPPTAFPTTSSPTAFPTEKPSMDPTVRPSFSPSASPTWKPTRSPTRTPSKSPTTSKPTTAPSKHPTRTPSFAPSGSPSVTPTRSPTNTACVNAQDKASCGFLAGKEGRCEWIAPLVCNGKGKACKTFMYGCQDRGFCNLTLPGYSKFQCDTRKAHCTWNAAKALCGDPCELAPPKAPFVRPNCASAKIPLVPVSSRAIRFAGTSFYDWSGRKVTGNGDMDGDKAKDFVIGSPNANPHAEGRPGRGWVNIILHSLGLSRRAKSVSRNYLTNDHIRINGTLDEGNFGEQMVLVDLDGDLLDDLVVSAPYASPRSRIRAGQVYIIWGQANFSSVWQTGVYQDIESAPSQYVTRIMGEGSPHVLGSDVARAGDFDGDGYSDLVVGAREGGIAGRSFCGEAFVIFGGSRGRFTQKSHYEIKELRTLRIRGTEAIGYLGTSVSGAGDFNKDGFADIVVGSPWVQTGIGRAFVIFGRAAPPAIIDLLTDQYMVGSAWSFVALHGQKSMDGWATFGTAVSMVGDVNVDGYDDVVIGAPFFSSVVGVKEVGRVYVFFGTNETVKTMDATRLTGADGGFYIDGIAAGDQLGMSISSGKVDFNGDGYADILLGAPFRNTQVGLGGQATVIYGRCTKYPARISLTRPWSAAIGTHISGARPGEALGISVENAGDVDGDGRTDLLLGAHFSEKQRGAAYIAFSC